MMGTKFGVPQLVELVGGTLYKQLTKDTDNGLCYYYIRLMLLLYKTHGVTHTFTLCSSVSPFSKPLLGSEDFLPDKHL